MLQSRVVELVQPRIVVVAVDSRAEQTEGANAALQPTRVGSINPLD